MKLYTATIESHRSKPGTLLVEGSVAEIIAFINSLGSTYGVYHFTPGDLEENGGNWGFPPEDWTTEAPYYYQHGDKTQGGFESLQEALIAYVDDDEGVLLKDWGCILPADFKRECEAADPTAPKVEHTPGTWHVKRNSRRRRNGI